MKEKILKKIDFIVECLNELKEYEQDYKASQNNKEQKKNYLLLKRVSEEMIETAIKINQLLLRDFKHFAKSYKDSFTDLSLFYEIDKKFFDKISYSAKFRNELAHEYIDMSEEYFLLNLKDVIKLYPKYIKEILTLIE